jgi:hypothetical protein
MATPHVTPSSVPHPPVNLHLQDGTGQLLRCGMVWSFSSTGEYAAICGALADQVCDECGPLCDQCFKETTCSTPRGNHSPVECVARNVNDVLTALLARRIVPTYALTLLRAFSAPAWAIERVEAIEAEAEHAFLRVARGSAVSPLRKLACVEAAAGIERRRRVKAAAWFAGQSSNGGTR